MTSVAEPASSVSKFPGPQDSPGFLLWRATLRWQRNIAAALRPLELTHVQFVLLASLWWLSGHRNEHDLAPSQRQVADQAGIDAMMTSQVVRALELRGLLTRTADSADARVKRLALTETGRNRAEQAVTVVEAVDTDFFATVPDQDQLLEVVRQLGDEHGQKKSLHSLAALETISR